jgi:energy-coupling factor transporter ATP-binding protein EcfA2
MPVESDPIIETTKGIVIIGSNGSGKSRCAKAIYDLNIDKPRELIYSQRRLLFPDSVSIISTNHSESSYRQKAYQTGDTNNPNRIADDFNEMVSLLFAKHNASNQDYVDQCRQKIDNPPVPNSHLDTLIEFWNQIFPHRRIKYSEGKITVYWPDFDIPDYVGSALSDGERSIFYLLGKCLIQPEKTLIIIDEPELHLHNSLMYILWNKLESIKNTCVFIYFTHNLDFAASRKDFIKLWIRHPKITLGYVPKDTKLNIFNIEKINENIIPPDLYYEILGSKGNILFIEGAKHKPEYSFYQYIFPDYYVISCGNCKKVIDYTNSLNKLNSSRLGHHSAVGIIDQDRRTNEDIDKLSKKSIFTLPVAEFENLLFMPSILKSFLNDAVNDDCHIIEYYYNNTLEYILGEFKKNIAEQKEKRVSDSIKWRLKQLSRNKINKKNFSDLLNSISYDEIYNQVSNDFYDAIQNRNYSDILRYINDKGLINRINTFISNTMVNKFNAASGFSYITTIYDSIDNDTLSDNYPSLNTVLKTMLHNLISER